MNTQRPSAAVHILLVSAQAAPNLLPALDPAMKPDEAVLVVTERMKPRAGALNRVLAESGIQTSQVDLVNEHDYAALQSTLLNLAAGREGDSIALNVTGGTKLMALAAQSIAETAGWAVFYVDADTDEVIWLGARAGERQPLTEQLRLRHYLMGYGFDIPAVTPHLQTPPAWQILIDTLLTQIGSLESPLGQLNWLAQYAEDRHTLSVTLDERQRDSLSFDALLRIFDQAGVLARNNDRVTFTDAGALTFARGGWLEHHVFRTVAGLTTELGLRDKAANLEVTDANGVRNELDVAFLALNRLFIVECKTARMDRPQAPKANDTLFKLAEIVRRVGGLGARGMLASYRPLRESELRLARALNIELACGPELTRLDEKLRAWVTH